MPVLSGGENKLFLMDMFFGLSNTNTRLDYPEDIGISEYQYLFFLKYKASSLSNLSLYLGTLY
jgi:hypothetical protein